MGNCRRCHGGEVGSRGEGGSYGGSGRWRGIRNVCDVFGDDPCRIILEVVRPFLAEKDFFTFS